MRSLGLLASASALCAAAAGCASTEDVRALRRPTLPPAYVALADRDSQLHENVAVYEILGAPEFVLFDGGDVITTRPTRAQVGAMLRTWLADADMLTDVRHADFLLSVQFENLRGPNVIPFVDKNAQSTVRYTLEERESRRVIFDHTYDATMQARMPGITPEMARAAIAVGLIAVAANAEADNSETTNAEAAAAGAAAGLAATAPAGLPPDDWDSADVLGAFDGTHRRRQAVGGMMRQSFNRFLFGLQNAGMLEMRRAVTCNDLNPNGYGTAHISVTDDMVAYDCP